MSICLKHSLLLFSYRQFLETGQVERRVVNQLALAHENGVLCDGCSVLVTAVLPSSPTEKARTLTDTPTPIILKVKKQQDTEFTEVDPAQQLKS